MIKNRKNIAIKPDMLIKLALVILFALQVFSYYKAMWTFEDNQSGLNILLCKFAYSNRYMEILRYLSLILILLVALCVIKHKKNDWIYILAFVVFPIVYTIDAVMELGLSTAMYSGNLPINYLLIFGFLLGRDENLWNGIKKIIPFLLVSYLVLFVYEFLDSFIQYGWVIYQNSSLMSYFSHLFWVTLTYVYIRVTEGRTMNLIFPAFVAIFIGAILLRSRSWLIQAVLLIIITCFTMYRRKGKNAGGFLKAILLLVAIVMICVLLLSTYLTPFVNSLIEKGDNDSRSFQYIEMLEQVEPYKWLLGQGMTATYISKLYGEYTFIDNEFFYMSFHYGVFFALTYFVPYVVTFIGCIKKRRNMRFWLFSALVVFLWVASVNGLSVFNRIHLDVKSFIMPFLAGHIYQTAKDSVIRRSEQ